MTDILILHGTAGSPKSNWFMWLKGKLVGRGYKVWLPQLPRSEQPNGATYTKFLLGNADFKFTKDTIIIGHSSGAVEILNLLQQLPASTKIKGAVLVSAFENDLGWDSLKDLIDAPLNFDTIKQHCNKFIFLHSDDDPYIGLDQPKHLAELTDGDLIVFSGQGHFNTETGPEYQQFPEILQFIEEILDD